MRDDTPVHSALHEACHYICMDKQRRNDLDTDAGGGYEEENGVCYLQILLADHLPDIRVIMAGESTGAIIIDTAMVIMADNPCVYSIQTGPPFWLQPYTSENTLVMRDNGITADSLSQGNFSDFIFGYVRYWLGLMEPEGNFGTPLHLVTPPGHDYWWQYPEVNSQITDFLRQHFGFD